MLEIIYQDEYLVAINKPHGLIVHPSPIARDAKESAMQLLRDQLGQYVYPIHRIDRKTCGVLVFALSKEVQKLMNEQFQEGLIQKRYLAIVRGFVKDKGIIDYELTNDQGKKQKAISKYTCIQKTSFNLPFNGHETSRYSLVELSPITGRHHQLRKHMAHIFHPIIGDRPHGCNKQNRLFKEKFKLTRMMLHAQEMTFIHPIKQEELSISARISDEFDRIFKLLFI